MSRHDDQMRPFWERCEKARRLTCPNALNKMWKEEMLAYRKARKIKIHVHGGVMATIAGNPYTPQNCLREASVHEYPAVHGLACGNHNTPLDAALEHVHMYKWCTLFALVHHPNAPHAMLEYIMCMPEDIHGGNDLNRDLRTKARERLGISPPRDENGDG